MRTQAQKGQATWSRSHNYEGRSLTWNPVFLELKEDIHRMEADESRKVEPGAKAGQES